jgi:hypothetical protein
VNSGLINPHVRTVAAGPAESGGASFFADAANGVYRATNEGPGWNADSSGLTDSTVQSLAVIGTNILAGSNDGVFLSTNSGTSWTEVNGGLQNKSVHSRAICPDGTGGTMLYAGSGGTGV